jgi:hypothetical protein
MDWKFDIDVYIFFTFRSQKGENRLLEPKKGIWGQKSVWSCDISIVREFYIEKQKFYFGDHKDRKKPSELNNGIRGPKSVWSCLV